MHEIITRAYAESQLHIWLDAQTAVASGQSYTIGRRTLTRANLKDILAMIDYWEAKLEMMDGQSPRARRVVPRDL